MPNPFQIYPSASKSINRHLGVSHLPRTHCLVVLVGRCVSEYRFHMLIEISSKTAASQPLPKMNNKKVFLRYSIIVFISVDVNNCSSNTRPHMNPAAFTLTALWN